MKKNPKKSHNAETPEKGDPLGFFIIHSVAKHRKSEGGPFEENFSKKMSHNAEKTASGTL